MGFITPKEADGESKKEERLKQETRKEEQHEDSESGEENKLRLNEETTW